MPTLEEGSTLSKLAWFVKFSDGLVFCAQNLFPISPSLIVSDELSWNDDISLTHVRACTCMFLCACIRVCIPLIRSSTLPWYFTACLFQQSLIGRTALPSHAVSFRSCQYRLITKLGSIPALPNKLLLLECLMVLCC